MRNQTSKKILYVITKSTWGGAGRYVYDLATHLPADHYEVSVALGGDGPLKQRLHAQGIRVLELHSLTRDVGMVDISAFLELYRLIKAERPDIIHLNSSKAGILGSLASSLLRIPTIIFTAHGWAHTEERPLISRIAIKAIHVVTVYLCHHVITVSEDTRKRIGILGIIPRRVRVIYNGIGTIGFLERNRARESLVEKTRAQKEHVWIGILAELHPNKGLRYAVEAAAELRRKGERQFSMMIIGEGEEREKLEKLIQKLSLENHVFLAGFLEEASRYLTAFDIFLLPSVKEGFPYSLLEAMAAELATITSDVGGVRELIVHNQTGIIVEPRNVDALTRALAVLVKNPRERHRLGEAVRNRTDMHFTLERMLAETTALYREH